MEEKNVMIKETKDVQNDYLYYVKNVNYYPLLTFEEEQKLAKLVRDGDREAREKLINSNLRLVIKIALQYYRPYINLMDLVQEGNIGLILAADKFDYRRKLRFSTYSSWWIKHYIARSIIKKENQIQLPLRKWELLTKVRCAINELSKKLNREPNLEEIENELQLKNGKIKDVINYIHPVLSLDTTIGMDSDLVLIDLLKSKDCRPEDMVIENDLHEYADKIMGCLVEREAQILKYRYGLNNCKKLTLKKIGKMIGVSAETVRQIELKALEKVRKNFKELREYITN